jgi:hypothetical protein
MGLENAQERQRPHDRQEATGQDLLNAGEREKLERLARATDRLRDRFGFSKLQLGGSLRSGEED